MSSGNSDSVPDTIRIEAGNSLSSIKLEEVISISRLSGENSGLYDVLSLKEAIGEQGPSSKLFRTQTADLPQSFLNDLPNEELPEYLQSGPSRHVYVIVSTGSGTGRALNFYNSALRPLLESRGVHALESSASAADRSKPNTYNLIVTQDADTIRDFGRELGRANKGAVQHTVILLSGDGGVTDLLNGKAPADLGGPVNLPLIAVLPLGTGNALFSSLHKPVSPPNGSSAPSSLVQSLRTLLRGTAAPLPSFEVTLTRGARIVSDAKDPGGVPETETTCLRLYGAIVASYGFHSQLVWESDTPEYRKYGDKRFGMVAEQLLKESHAYHATVEYLREGEPQVGKLGRDRHAYILATMVSNLEKTFTISPSSKPLDGKLRLVHFGPVSGEKTMEIMMQAYDGGKHVNMRWTGEDGKEGKVGYDELVMVHVVMLEEDARWRKVCVDGTIVEVPQGGSVTVATDKQRHLQVLVDPSVVG